MLYRSRTSRSRRLAGFTLVELMVAIGAIAIIAVGIAAIFAAIGRTVAGGRRVGQLNQYAALIERQMRADFEAMTRDGVLVIRHEEAEEGAPVELWEEDANPRPRRVDQIVFFVRGDFTSARTPLIPGVNATSSEAMVRYGHGMRLDPISDYDQGGTPRYERPEVDDGQFPASSGAPFRDGLAIGSSTPPIGNPNRFASEWTLLRNLTLLVPPGSSEQNLPLAADPVWGELGIARIDAVDNELQVGGQPAAASVFSSLQRVFPTNYPGTIRAAAGDDDRYLSLASGLVDVATTDLAEIRRIISDVGENPWAITAETQLYDPTNQTGFLDDQFTPGTGPGSDLAYVQRWMDELLPTHQHDLFAAYDTQIGLRPRYEESFPDFVGTLSEYDSGGSSVAEQNMRLADQLMLSSAIFVPRCTEFIVEYSFGQTINDLASPANGQLIWYGKERSRAGGVQVVGSYPNAIDPITGVREVRVHGRPYLRLDGSTGTESLGRAELYRTPDNGGADPDILTAHFGYTDPSYTPTAQDDPPTVPWAWPKLIRITMTLADPTDPSIEQTFQFVFETPEADDAI